jgi:adenosylhomocysteine nucleosidase
VHITGVVAALRAEARALRPLSRSSGAAAGPAAGLMVQISGMGCERAARSAHRLVRAGARSLLCWGVAGALDPSLRCGDIVLATEVICESALSLHLESMRPTALPAHARLRTSAPWRERMESALARQGPVVQGALLTSQELVCGAALKSRLFHETAALAVDMESAAVGVVARLHGVPFMVLRVVADTAADALPAVLQRAVGSDRGDPLAWLSWLSLAAAPTAWPGLIRLGRRYRAARQVLRHCAPCAGLPEAARPGAAVSAAPP